MAHLNRSNRVSARVTAALMVLAGALAMAACGSSDGDSSSSSSSSGSCAPTNAACPALAIKSDCLGLVDNAGKDKFALRLSQLSITAPKVLTDAFVAKLVGDGVFINLPTCNLAGQGTFSLITEFDRKAGKLRVGGAKPEQNPAGGYCFANDPANNIAPVEVAATFTAGGGFSIDPIAAITLPIYLDIAASSTVYLPLRMATLVKGTISADNNCIGSFNASGLQPANQCKPDLEVGINYFVDGATLEGHIQLEEADAVVIDLLNPKQTLCVLLSGDDKMFGEADKDGVIRCKRDANMKIVLEGDWCSATNSAGGCKDSYRLQSTIAGSSVKVRTDCP